MILKYYKRSRNILLLMLAVVLAESATAQSLQQPAWSNNAVMYELNIRQYSEQGTISAVTSDLSRIKKLGTDVIWVMPPYPIGEKNRKGGMGSYYSVKDYRGFAANYGSKDDFKKFVAAAHAKNMRVIIDWVANHTAWDHEWITKHPDWYVQDSTGKIVTQYDWTDVAKLNFSNAAMRSAMIDDMKYWVQEFDIDGFRCDVAFLVPLDFWMDARKALEQVKPMYMLAEMEWNADITTNPATYFEQAFNAAYGWNFMGVTSNYAKGKKTIAELKKELTENYARFPKHMHKLYFLTNHDENSWNGTVDEKYGKNWQQVGVMVYTMPNTMPLIYTGEEVGLNRRLKFFEKDPITSEEWKNKTRVEWYQSMTSLRHTVPAFSTNLEDSQPQFLQIQVAEKNANQVLAYKRSKGSSEAFIFINFAEANVMINLPGKNFAKDFKGFKQNSNGNVMVHGEQLMLSPNSYVIYYK